MSKKPVSTSLPPSSHVESNQQKLSKIEENQIINFEVFQDEFKKQFETSILGSLWNSITRSSDVKLEDLLLFAKKFPAQIEFVENVCEKLETEFSGILKSELKKVKITKESHGVRAEGDIENEMSVKCELKCWNPANVNLSFHKFSIFISEKSLFVSLTCQNTVNCSWEWRSRTPDEIITKFKQGFQTETYTVSDENISNGLLNGIFDIYGASDKLKLLKYWKDKKVSYKIKTGRKAIISNSKILFRNFKLVFDSDAIYNIENVNPERIESITYCMDLENYLNPSLKAKRIVLGNISFYSTCILMSKFNPPMCNNYHNMVTNLKGKAKIGTSVKKSHWIGEAKKKAYKYDFENGFIYNFERGYESYSKMPKNDFLELEGFCHIVPFKKREIFPLKNQVIFNSLSSIYEFSHEAHQLINNQPNLNYLPISVNPSKVTGHFEGTLHFHCDGNLLCESNFFIDTILGYVLLDLSHFGLGWCKFYKISQSKTIGISSKCPTDISFICLN